MAIKSPAIAAAEESPSEQDETPIWDAVVAPSVEKNSPSGLRSAQRRLPKPDEPDEATGRRSK